MIGFGMSNTGSRNCKQYMQPATGQLANNKNLHLTRKVDVTDRQTKIVRVETQKIRRTVSDLNCVAARVELVELYGMDILCCAVYTVSWWFACVQMNFFRLDQAGAFHLCIFSKYSERIACCRLVRLPCSCIHFQTLLICQVPGRWIQPARPRTASERGRLVDGKSAFEC